ncbi:hypothetical protein D9M68_849780 [compost metagenome]
MIGRREESHNTGDRTAHELSDLATADKAVVIDRVPAWTFLAALACSRLAEISHQGKTRTGLGICHGINQFRNSTNGGHRADVADDRSISIPWQKLLQLVEQWVVVYIKGLARNGYKFISNGWRSRNDIVQLFANTLFI